MILPTSPDFRGFQGLLQQNPHGSKVGFHGSQSLSNRCLPSQARGAEREWLFRKRLEKVGDLLAHTKLMHLYTPILKHGTHTQKPQLYTQNCLTCHNLGGGAREEKGRSSKAKLVIMNLIITIIAVLVIIITIIIIISIIITLIRVHN